MTMPSGNVVLSDKMQYPSGAGAGGEIHQQPRQWYPDERDGFISWLRGEFAAANAIVDSLCHHLRAVGEPSEYDMVIGHIQQRRCNWTPVLHMQQYFSVAEVQYALQQVAWRRQQRLYEPAKMGNNKDYKRSNSGVGFKPRSEPVKEWHNNASVEYRSYDGSGLEKVVSETREEVKSGREAGKVDDKGSALGAEKKGDLRKPHEYISTRSSGNSQGTVSSNSGAEDTVVNDGCTSTSKDNESHSIQIQNDKHNLSLVPKTFVGNETFDGKTINVVDGLKLYEEFLGDTEVSKLCSLVNDLRATGKRGHIQAPTYVTTKRPMKGHGREMIQLGIPIADAPQEDDISAGISKDRRTETIPPLLQDVIDRLIGMHVLTVKPDSCIIDFFNEGDHSQPNMWPTWFGRPVSVLFLTECDLTFGRALGIDYPGDYRGSLRLSLAPGSLLLLQGKSADYAKHAIPSIRKQRILVTFTKSQPRKSFPTDGQRLPSSGPSQSPYWSSPPSRSPNHIRHPVGPKHYAAVSTTGVLPAPPNRPQLPPANGIPPLFVAAPVGPPMPFPAPVVIPPGSPGWVAAPRHPPPRMPLPGTGVFLPPGSGSSSAPPQQFPSTATEMNPTVETASTEKDNGSGKSSHAKLDGKTQKQDCNGSVDVTGSGRGIVKQEQQQNSNNAAANSQAGAV
ncbi:RNA demethylase ALKBH10B [Argentina anserina]|uniref:RNA demethylase ALKBH10B n=1 Tax=Argentina anserina TaxID=57926 RepID=UPI0021767009|nr:RNA demethylase ALKBH10B [Potentilla anserina]